MSDVAIRVEGLGKRYRIGASQAPYRTLRETLVDLASAPVKRIRRSPTRDATAPLDNTIWALKDVSFEVKQGEVVGIIGRNGAGKSTLLKILSRITKPTQGRVTIAGRVGSLLEVGTGFHPELTGRENIYLNGAILGMRRAEIDRKFDEIVAFAEIDQFLDTPVKRYSSGMYVRLAFAVAAHMETETLVVDEVLAVGDAAFQKKSLDKMGNVSRGGRTILFVSHNMNAVRALCPQALWLLKGRLVRSGPTEAIVQEYLRQFAGEEGTRVFFHPQQPIQGRNIALLEAGLHFEGDVPNNGQTLLFRATIEVRRGMQFAAHMTIYRESAVVAIASDYHAPVTPSEIPPGLYTLEFEIPPYLLNPGIHSLGLMLSDYSGNAEQYLSAQDVVWFSVEDDGYRRNQRYHLGWGGAVSPILAVRLGRRAK